MLDIREVNTIVKTVLDKPVKKIWSLNQLKTGESLIGIPKAEHYINKKQNQFIKLGIDYGHATCNVYFLIFDFPEQKILGNKFNNSFELVRFYRLANEIAIDDNITMFHDINWEKIINWLNGLNTLEIKAINENMNGFKNIVFTSFTNLALTEEVGFQKWII